MGSVTNRSKEGAALLEKAREQYDLLNMLAALEEPLLTRIVSVTAEAFDKARAKQISGKLRKDDVQELFVSLLTALAAARPHGCLKPHDKHTTGLGGMPNSRPDLVVTDSESALAPHVVDYFEIKPVLAEEAAQRDAAYQLDERRRQLKLGQPYRGVFWGCSSGLDCVQLWRFDRHGAAQRSPLLPLNCHRNSAGLQALIRFWCTPAHQKGFVSPIIPKPIQLQRDQGLFKPENSMVGTTSEADDTASADVTSVVVGILEPGNKRAVAKTTTSEQRLKREVRVLQPRGIAGYTATCKRCIYTVLV